MLQKKQHSTSRKKDSPRKITQSNVSGITSYAVSSKMHHKNNPQLHPQNSPDNATKKLPRCLKKYDFEPYNGEKLKIAVVGGLEEIGRNMTMMEYEDEIILIDMGLQFPEESMLGIDYIIPDISYFKGKEKKIKGVIITHGHYDHIGGIPHIMSRIGNPPMFMGKLTAGLVRARQEDFKNLDKLNITEIDDTSKTKLGNHFRIEYFRVNHTIPDSFGIAIYTPVGLIIHTGDFKIDFSPIPPDLPANLGKYANLGNEGVLALMLDSTNADQPGHQISEAQVKKELEKVFFQASGRIIVGTFASQISRIQILLELSRVFGRKVIFEGRSMLNNVDICHKLGYLKVNPGQIVDPKDAKHLPDKKVVIVGTGAQGQDNAFLVKLATDEHKHHSLKQGDTVIFSSSVIPGNERTVQNLKDTFCKKGAKVIHTDMMDVHAGGHAKEEDVKMMMRLIRPRYFIPIEATRFKIEMHAQTARNVGIHDPRIFVCENGQIMEFTRSIGNKTNKKIPTEYVFVDGLGVDDVNHVVLRDRKMMSEDGMFIVIATIQKKTGQLVGSPDIISRGFIYMKESQKLIEQTRNKVKKILTDKDPLSGADGSYIKAKIRNEIGQFLYSKTNRRPMVLPVVVEV